MPGAESLRSLPDRYAPETHTAVSALSVATGGEHPVRSPALELQEALEEMLATQAIRTPVPANAVALGVGLIAVAGVCSAFWIGVGRMLIALA